MSATCTPSEAAEAINVSVEDLMFWCQLGLRPAYIELGPAVVRYPHASLRRWAAGQLETQQQRDCPHCGGSLHGDDTLSERDPGRP